MRVYALKNWDSPYSSSGGAFPAIVAAFHRLVGNGLVVYGAAFTKEFDVKYRRIPYLDGIYPLLGSKYVESELTSILPALKEDIESDLPVFFVGTPCQVQAVRKLVVTCYRNANPNLLTVDLICHGTPKRELWLDYVKYMQEKRHYSIKKISFRYRTGKVDEPSMGFAIEKEDGIIEITPSDLKTYMRLFSRNLSLNRRCFHCSHRNAELSRPGDFTIGDFWGVSEVMKNFKNKGGVSLVIANTEKAGHILDEMERVQHPSCSLEECRSDKYLIFNPHLNIQTRMPHDYEQFWHDYKTMRITDLDKKYAKENLFSVVKIKLVELTEMLGIKWKLKKILWYLHRNKSYRR